MTTQTATLHDAANAYALGALIADDLPAVARQAVKGGLESPSLHVLAIAHGLGNEELRGLFLGALAELGIEVPTPDEAGLRAARAIAQDVLSGTISPYAGARRIWVEVYTRCPQLGVLRPLVGFASEYEDDAGHADAYARLIVEECKGLTGAR